MVKSQRLLASLFFILILLLGAATQLFAQSPVDFGPVPVGSSMGATQTLTFTIPPGSTLGAVAVVTQGAPNLDFTATGGTCANGSTASCTVQVQFLPLVAGIRLGALVLTDQSTPPVTLFTTLLSGTGTGPVVTFPPGIMSTVIGGTAGGTTAGLSYPNGVGLDAAGNVYAVSSYNSTVYKLSHSGVTTRIAGGNGNGYGGDGGLATAARLYYPTTIRVDGAGNIYIVDDGNNLVRMINPAGIITTVAGLAPGSVVCAQATDQWGDGCPATQASLDFFDSYYGEGGTATDASGNLYIGDTAHNLIRKVSAADGTISIFAGTGVAGYSGDGGPATNAQLNNPDGGVFDSAGNFYFADLYNNVIRMIAPDGTISTVAGNGQYGHSGDGGPATSAQLGYPYQVAVDAAGNLYITDSGNFTEGDPHEVIRKVTPGGIITSVAGVTRTLPAVTYSGDGGPATSATMWGPVDIGVDGAGNLYIADDYNHAIRKVDVSDAPALAFTSTAVGAGGAQDVSVLNVGNSPLTIDSVVPSSNFSLGGADTTCSATNQMLNPSLSCVLGIDFLGQTGGHLYGNVVLTDDTENATSATQTITMKALPVISWATPKAITYGTAISSTQLNAKVTYNGKTVAGTTTYLLPMSNYQGVPSVAGGTKALGAVLGAGQQTLWAVFTPADVTDYAPASASVILQVNAGVPKITWANPAAIPYGTQLSGTQLDATTTVSGTFTYSPAAGTILPVGSTTLNVTFTPYDTTDYQTVTGKATQVVQKATTTTTVVPSMNASTYGESVTFTATITPEISGTPTGTAVFKSNGVALGTATLSGGMATLTTAKLAVGTDSVTVVYNGDSSFLTSTSGALSQNVVQDITTTTLMSSVNPSTLKQAVTFTASVTAVYTTVSGNVTFYNGATPLSTVNLSQGVAHYTTSALPAGANNITAVYNVSTDYTSSTSPIVVQQVN